MSNRGGGEGKEEGGGMVTNKKKRNKKHLWTHALSLGAGSERTATMCRSGVRDLILPRCGIELPRSN